MEHYLKLSFLIVAVIFLTIHAWLKHYDPILPQIAVIGLATIPSFMDTVSTLPSASVWLWLRFALVLSLVLSFCVHVLVRYDAAVTSSLHARFAAAANRCVYYATQGNSKLHFLYRNVIRTDVDDVSMLEKGQVPESSLLEDRNLKRRDVDSRLSASITAQMTSHRIVSNSHLLL